MSHLFALWAFDYREEQKAQFKPEECPHESTNNRGSSRSTHQCCSFIDSMELRRGRVALAKADERATQDKVSDDQDALIPEGVGRIMGIFSGLVETAMFAVARLHDSDSTS